MTHGLKKWPQILIRQMADRGALARKAPVALGKTAIKLVAEKQAEQCKPRLKRGQPGQGAYNFSPVHHTLSQSLVP